MSRINIIKVVIPCAFGMTTIAVAPFNLGIAPHPKFEAAEHARISANDSI